MIRPGREFRQKVSRLRSKHNLLLLESMIASCIEDTSDELGTYISVRFSNDLASEKTCYYNSNVVTITCVDYSEISQLIKHIIGELDDVGGYIYSANTFTIHRYLSESSHEVLKISWI